VYGIGHGAEGHGCRYGLGFFLVAVLRRDRALCHLCEEMRHFCREMGLFGGSFAD